MDPKKILIMVNFILQRSKIPQKSSSRIARIRQTPCMYHMSSQNLNYTPSYHLTPLQPLEVIPEAESVFFDLDIDRIPPGAQVLAGLFEDPSGKGHLETLNGVSIQFDALTGWVLDTLHEESEIGRLETPLSRMTNIRLSFRLDRLGNTFIPTLEVVDRNVSLETPGGFLSDRFDLDSGSTDFILPAFQASGTVRLTPLVGYYTERDAAPLFGRHAFCSWPMHV